MESDKILSQDEINALVEGDQPRTLASLTEQPAQYPEPVDPTEPAPEPPQAEAIPHVVQVTPEPQNFTPAPEPTSQIEASISETTNSVQKVQTTVQELSDRLQSIAGKIERIEENLQATPGYGAKNSFTCVSCSTEGMVAMPARCTQCGHQTWWGWYPPQQ